MGKGAEALTLGALGILGLGFRTGVDLSMPKIPVTEDPNLCAIVANAREGLNLRRLPQTFDNEPIGSLRYNERLPYNGVVTRVRGENVDPARSDGSDWYNFTTIDGRNIFVSVTHASNSCPDRQAQR